MANSTVNGAPSPLAVAYYPRCQNPLAFFMADMKDRNDFALDDVLQGLPVPDSCRAPPALSLQVRSRRNEGTTYSLVTCNTMMSWTTRHHTMMFRTTNKAP